MFGLPLHLLSLISVSTISTSSPSFSLYCLDYLINNAGTNTAVGPLVETDLSRFRSTFEANYFGLIAVTQAVAPHMIKKRSGKIINIGSTAGLAPLPYSSAYSSSKAAVHAISDVLRLELQGFGISVVVVAPGAIKSSIGDAGSKDIEVPESSNYHNVRDVIAFRAVYSQQGNPTPTDQFAQTVLRAVQPRNPRAYLVAGAKSSMVLLLYYLPVFIKDRLISRIFQMGRIGVSIE